MRSTEAWLLFGAISLLGCAMEVAPEGGSDDGFDDVEEVGTSSQAVVNDGRGSLPGECFGGIDCLVQDVRNGGGTGGRKLQGRLHDLPRALNAVVRPGAA
jgi:hypothetical protein